MYLIEYINVVKPITYIDTHKLICIYVWKLFATILVFYNSFFSDTIQQESKKYSSIIINADGVYIATFMSLYLNLKLINQNYYDDSSVLPIMSEVSLN